MFDLLTWLVVAMGAGRRGGRGCTMYEVLAWLALVGGIVTVAALLAAMAEDPPRR